jgi:branched-chain amino acid transport system ATP-binding protein
MAQALVIQGLSKKFGGLQVTDNVNLELSAGERVALIGPNGAGKTTLVNLITGHIRPDSGTVHLGERDITAISATDRVKAGLVRSFQVTRLFSEMSPIEHVALAVLQREGRTSRMFGSFRSSPEVMGEAKALLQSLGLAECAEIPVSDIAYGQQRLVEMAIALALKPRVLLLDEPAAGVPQSDTALIEKTLFQLPSDLCVLMIDHDMDLVFRFATRVVVLAAGAIIFDGAPSDATRNEDVRKAYLGSYADASSHA